MSEKYGRSIIIILCLIAIASLFWSHHNVKEVKYKYNNTLQHDINPIENTR
jgi:hypothetical protein